jgi:hypothetical protein
MKAELISSVGYNVPVVNRIMTQWPDRYHTVSIVYCIA